MDSLSTIISTERNEMIPETIFPTIKIFLALIQRLKW
uniref:Uncharacterized protein n=1 Tax=Ascaris lumbricoides TaxID=6252 RepID=A0A0M3ILE1_ASCLU